MQSSHVTFDRGASLTSHQLLPANTRRRTITIYPSTTADVTISNDSPVVAGNGITIPKNGAPIYLDIDFQGEAVQQEWYAIYVGGTFPVGIIEGLL